MKVPEKVHAKIAAKAEELLELVVNAGRPHNESASVNSQTIHSMSIYDLFMAMAYYDVKIEAITKDSEPKWTIDEFRNYLDTQDSRGDIHHFLTEEYMREANLTQEERDSQ